MKQSRSLTMLLAVFLGFGLFSATAQDREVNGTLNLAANTHFVSYGLDVWGAGNDLDDILFNPSLEISTELSEGVTGTLGVWFDINNNAETTIGDELVQEVDAYAGVGWSMGDVDVSLTYQEWMYAGQSERIVDLGLGFPGALSPSLTIHGRVDGEDLETGIVAVAGIEPSIPLGSDYSLPISLNVAGNTDEYHGGDSGFTYASVGTGYSFPLGAGTSLDLGLTYYFTNEDTVPSNPDDSFLTGSAGVSLSW